MTDDEASHRRICLKFVAAHGAPKFANYERVYEQIGEDYPGDLYIAATSPVDVDGDLDKVRERIRNSAGPGAPLADGEVEARLAQLRSVQAETISRWEQEAGGKS